MRVLVFISVWPLGGVLSYILYNVTIFESGWRGKKERRQFVELTPVGLAGVLFKVMLSSKQEVLLQ